MYSKGLFVFSVCYSVLNKDWNTLESFTWYRETDFAVGKKRLEEGDQGEWRLQLSPESGHECSERERGGCITPAGNRQWTAKTT